jgi:photosystem II stability/assembly factor-like uncharacterized protein
VERFSSVSTVFLINNSGWINGSCSKNTVWFGGNSWEKAVLEKATENNNKHLIFIKLLPI